MLLAIFTLSIFLSAALLFMVQPMAGKILLPLLGGSPAVWNTCMVFFQGVLLAGYGYSHLLTTRLAQRRQALVHSVLLALAAATLPMPVDVGDPGSADPVGWLVATLAPWLVFGGVSVMLAALPLGQRLAAEDLDRRSFKDQLDIIEYLRGLA